MPSAKAKPAEGLHPEPASYEAALAELESLVRALEATEMPLDQLLKSHQRGSALLSWCRIRLQAVEQQVQVFEDGQVKPFLGAAASGAASATSAPGMSSRGAAV